MMFFASAAFLAGLALLTVPWWLHRLNAHPAEQRTFSSLFLMRPSEAPVNMRRRLQHLLLLALRWLLLIAACLAFAEPVLELAGTPAVSHEPEAHRLLVVDTSLSMSAAVGGGLAIDRARERARELIDRLPAGAKAALVSAADELLLAVPLTDDQARLLGAAATLEAGAARLDFDGLPARLTTLGETLVAPGERLEVHLISDFQASGLPDQFNALVDGSIWPVRLHPVLGPGEQPANRALTSLRPDAAGRMLATVRSFGAPGGTVDVILTRNGAAAGRESLFVPEDGSASAAFVAPPADLPAAGAPGAGSTDRRHEVVIWEAVLAAGDALAADDVRRQVSADAQTTTLPVISGDDRSFAYLRAAVQAAAPRFVPERVTEIGDTRVPVVAVLDPGVLAGGLERMLGRYLESGGAVLMTAGVQTRSAGRLPLVDRPLAADRFDQSPRGAVAADRSHPVLAGFAPWQDLRFFQAVQPAPGTAGEAGGIVILALDDGTPLLTEHRMGAGTLMVLGTALDPGWSTLVVRPAFVGFVARTLGYLAEDLLPSEALVGRPFAIPAQSVQLFDVSGERVLGLADTVGRPTVSLDHPGIYQLRTPSSSRHLAVNTDLAESDLSQAPAALLARWQAIADGADPAATAPGPAPAGGETPGSRLLPLAPWLLALLCLLVLLEPLAANLLTSRDPSRDDRRAGSAAEAST